MMHAQVQWLHKHLNASEANTPWAERVRACAAQPVRLRRAAKPKPPTIPHGENALASQQGCASHRRQRHAMQAAAMLAFYLNGNAHRRSGSAPAVLLTGALLKATRDRVSIARRILFPDAAGPRGESAKDRVGTPICSPRLAAEPAMLSRIVGAPVHRLVSAPSSTAVVPRRILSTNVAARRPLSPHLQIYKLPFNAVTSVAFRATGILLTLGTAHVYRCAGAVAPLLRASPLLSFIYMLYRLCSSLVAASLSAARTERRGFVHAA
jgi:hypothetical protein